MYENTARPDLAPNLTTASSDAPRGRTSRAFDRAQAEWREQYRRATGQSRSNVVGLIRSGQLDRLLTATVSQLREFAAAAPSPQEAEVWVQAAVEIEARRRLLDRSQPVCDRVVQAAKRLHDLVTTRLRPRASRILVHRRPRASRRGHVSRRRTGFATQSTPTKAGGGGTRGSSDGGEEGEPPPPPPPDPRGVVRVFQAAHRLVVVTLAHRPGPETLRLASASGAALYAAREARRAAARMHPGQEAAR